MIPKSRDIINNNSNRGVYLDDFKVIAESSAQNTAGITGNLNAAVSNTPITFAFSDNAISGNNFEGVYVNAIDINAYALAGSSVTGNVSASLADTEFSSTFTSNTISGNSAGVYYANGYAADAGAKVDGAPVGGNVMSDISKTFMTYTFTDNQLTGNNGEGVYISGNKMIFSNRAENSATIGGDMTGAVADSAITLTVERNTIRSNRVGSADSSRADTTRTPGGRPPGPARMTISGVSSPVSSNSVG